MEHFDNQNAIEVLTEQEIASIGGGDSWAGTAEGRAPAETSWGEIMLMALSMFH